MWYKNGWWFFAILNTRCARSGDIVLYVKLHFHKEFLGPQHLHWWYPQPHCDECCKRATQFAYVIFHSFITSFWWMMQEGHSICTCDFPFIHNLIVMNVVIRPFNLQMQFSILGVDMIVSMWILFNLENKFSFCLQELKISSLSMCVILIVNNEPNAYFKIAFASYFGSLDWVALHKRSSFLLGP